MKKKEIASIIDKLISLGEDKEELEYWLSIFEDLPDRTQKQLSKNLKNELDILQDAQ